LFRVSDFVLRVFYTQRCHHESALLGILLLLTKQGSIVADPKFANAAEGDFQLAPDSPALKLGFQPFDYREAGVYGDAAWRAKANDVTYPPLEIIPEPPSP